ncbi:MAG: glycerate kinase [Clostridia bacterium]|nr:glycerate kinase [Clostridia bacterium]
MNILLAPDSFKGTLSATEVCALLRQEILSASPDALVTALPIADGGEGTVDAFLHIFGGTRVTVRAHSPLLHEMDADYAVLPDGTAVIETAAASGIAIELQNDALHASTFGTGELFCDALNRGCRKIVLGLGGSATTDGGAGLLTALGARFLDADKQALQPGGAALERLQSIDLSGLDKRLQTARVTVLCDVKNPLFGKNGAAAVFAPQKGADAAAVATLDRGLRTLADVSAKTLGASFSACEGAGAAGGLGFACLAFLQGTLTPGIDYILDAASFAERAKIADLIITGEGKMDAQSLMGKAPFGVAKRSGGTRVIAIVGQCDATPAQLSAAGIAKVYETNALHRPFSEVKARAKEDFCAAAKLLWQAEGKNGAE